MALLVIMIIIVITTAAAAVSVRNTTAEMQAAGRERILTQARYAAEAAMQSTLAYIDLLIVNDTNYLKVWDAWQAAPPPQMRAFTGGHSIDANNRHMAARTSQIQQARLDIGPLIEPVSGPDPTIPDPTGSFGPSQPYVMEPYIVDITDCALSSTLATPGGAVNVNASGTTPQRFDCTLTVRGRISPAGDTGATVTWDLAGLNGVVQERSGAGYDTRATITTPPLLMPNQ